VSSIADMERLASSALLPLTTVTSLPHVPLLWARSCSVDAVQDTVLPLLQQISAANGVSTSLTTSTVSGLPQESCVILSVTSHLVTMFVERSLSLINVLSILLLK